VDSRQNSSRHVFSSWSVKPNAARRCRRATLIRAIRSWRDVAIKILPEAFSHDADRDAEFLGAGKGPRVPADDSGLNRKKPNFLRNLS
jgi:hypothetical protein